MATSSLHTSISPRSFLSLSKPSRKPHRSQVFLRINKRRSCVSCALVHDETDVIPVQSGDRTDHEEGSLVVMSSETERDVNEPVVVGFGAEQLSFEGFPSSSPTADLGDEKSRESEEMEKMIDRSINATIVLAAGTYAITKLLTIDHDYWHGWTLFEILRYAPQHNWLAYEEALKRNPVLAKMVISGVVYSVGDWIAQCYEGKPLFEIDRARTLRSGLVGFTLHGSLSHFYYQFCEELFPFQDWWVVPAKVAFDQTVWSAIWNSIYFTVLGFLRLESPLSIFKELKATFLPMLTAGWKLWPFAHLITYGLVPVEQRLLWVDCVELIWVTILSTYSNEKSEARLSESVIENSSSSTTPIDPSKVLTTSPEPFSFE
ncbi:BnaA06g01790D [Brassica napus]|uniref:BnaA06g01790D protein n=1 Tax=Brassica napus TaxID=3708 RepID=A0A078IWP5_BRANA|nr:BnaA06g01790D [Brassica napus]